MKTILTALARLLSYHREVLWPLFAIALAVLAIFGVHHLTGRPVIDDPGAIIGMLYTLIGIMLAALATGQVQQHLIGFRSERAESDARPTLGDDVFDAVITLLLLWGFCSLLLK
jgi:4-amino-4-deoxy-L-arabinose transferase-like glycosyltransferase